MPLQQGSSQETISANIAELVRSGHDPKQAAAIAYRVAGKDRTAKDMKRDDWGILKRLISRWITEEEDEPEHAGDEANSRGELSETERESAGRVGSEHREEEPEGVFLEPGSRKYPVKVKRDGEWKYDRGLLLAAAREARMHGHEDLAKRADEIRGREFGSANDEALITLDRAPSREYDQNGYLHLASTNISKANICPYWGREIPKAGALGLDPDRQYLLLRDPVELERAADTFKGLPLLWRHKPTDADNHPTDIVIGSIGDDVEFERPYLKASLHVWPRYALEAIESEVQKELSCGYQYVADMTPGTYEGQPYDGRMTNIVGNHIALVQEGRAGPDVVVADSQIDREWLILERALAGFCHSLLP